MALKIIFCSMLFQLVFFPGKAQSDGDTLLILSAERSLEYNIYEINKTFFSFSGYGHKLLLKPKHLVAGKQYLKKGKPYWLRTSLPQEEKIPYGTIVKPYRGNRSVDTFLYKGIELKYPIEIDGKLLKHNVTNNKETQPIIINGFQFVKNCAKYPYRHFEIFTKK